jgi:hypothetical protein
MRLICLFFIGMFLSLSGESQSFDYNFSKDSVAWQELNSQTILNNSNSAWNFSYKIPIGFTFNYLGRSFDSLTIETNGYLVFDANRNYALTAFLGFGDCVDSSSNHSILGYEVSGSNGNKILKIQFKNVGSSNQTSKHFSYQIWLKESGAVEIHLGPNDYQPGMIITNNDTILTNRDSLQFYRVGLINMNMDTQTRGFFIGGNLSSPDSQPVDDNHPDPIFLMRAPSSGTRYTFTPNSN